jgi:hypothetical protein
LGGVNGNYRGYEAIKALAAALGKAGATSRGRPVPIETLLALDEKNDPFYAGAPAHRARAEWFADVWRRFGRSRSHLRAVHYWLVNQKPAPRRHDGSLYQNTVKDWKYLDESSKYARYLGLIPAEAIDDHRNPEPHIYMRPLMLSRDRRVTLETLADWFLPEIASELADAIELTLTSVEEVSGYDYDATDQPYHVEVWIEKSTMDDVLEPICAELHVNLITSIGFQSISSVIKLLRWVCEFARICAAGKPVRVFYISDFDPAGDSMPVAVARQIEYWLQDYAPRADIKLTPLALTREQVKTYKLPRIPIKDTDTRKGGFEDRYGEDAVELDALEALRPGELARLVREAIAPYRDETLSERLDEAAEDARERAKAAWNARMAPYAAEVEDIKVEARRLVAGYADALRRLNNRLQEELVSLHERAARVRQAVKGEIERFDVDLPERPEPETEPVDEDEWLYASDRGYFTQLDMYKARKNGQASEGFTA